MLKISNITYYISYVVGVIALLFGVVVLSGIGFQNVPQQIRLTFGAVLVLWGIYRFVVAWSNYRQRQKDGDEE
jgi:membrane protease YdiL (CAAX protease family)